MKIIKPPIRWTGGKQHHIQEIIDRFPILQKGAKYYEPFAGAGSIFLNTIFERKIISDVNPHLINMFNQIALNPKWIFKELNLYKNKYIANSAYYYILRNKFNCATKEIDKTTAAIFIFLMQSNYNGVFRVNKSGHYNVPKGKIIPSIPTLEHLTYLKSILNDTTLICCSYNEIFKEIESNDLVYIDPPYPKKDWKNMWNIYTTKRFEKEDHMLLYNYLNDLNKKEIYIVVSLPDIPFVKSIYSGWNIKRLKTNKLELLITNY